MKSLDDLVRSELDWAGCWRPRQVLKYAAAVVRLMGRTEDETALRYAVLLVAADDDPGPAGKVYSAYKRLATRKPGFLSRFAAELADLMGLGWDDHLAAAVEQADAALQSGRPAPFTAAELMTAIHVERSDAEMLAWALADMLIPAMLKWSVPLPLLITELYGPAFRTIGAGDGRGPAIRPFRGPSASLWSTGPAQHCAPCRKSLAGPTSFSQWCRSCAPRGRGGHPQAARRGCRGSLGARQQALALGGDAAV